MIRIGKVALTLIAIWKASYTQDTILTLGGQTRRNWEVSVGNI